MRHSHCRDSGSIPDKSIKKMNNRQLKEKADELAKLVFNCTREFPNLQIALLWDMGAYIADPIISEKSFVPDDRDNLFIKFAPRQVAEQIRSYHLTFGNSKDHVSRFGGYLGNAWKEKLFLPFVLQRKAEIGCSIIDEIKIFRGVNLANYLR